MLTLTFHRPYEFPGSDRLANPDGSEAQQLAAVRFCDAAIGEFIDAARQQDWFANTVFVFVADHMGGSLQYPRGPWMNRVPMIFYGPGIEGLEPRRIGGVRSQMDVAPTVMGLLGGAYEHTFFGRDPAPRRRRVGLCADRGPGRRAEPVSPTGGDHVRTAPIGRADRLPVRLPDRRDERERVRAER
jgi:hypothetical protein